MVGSLDSDKRRFLAGAAAIGAGVAAASVRPRDAAAQLLDTGIDPKSVLAKVKKGETLQVGYAQTPVWFYKDAKTGELRGIYKDLADMLAKDLEMRVNYVEVTFANATIGLRKGDFDLFGSSAVYTIPRALVCNYIGPLWSKAGHGGGAGANTARDRLCDGRQRRNRARQAQCGLGAYRRREAPIR